MSRHVFTYGSLMFDEVWSRVVTAAYRSTPARLADHARHAIVDETYPGMVAEAGAVVEGVLYLEVDDDDVARLDRFEGDDYVRREVAVTKADGESCVADTYVYRLVDRLLPSPWEPDTFAMQRFLDTYCADRLPKAD